MFEAGVLAKSRLGTEDECVLGRVEDLESCRFLNVRCVSVSCDVLSLRAGIATLSDRR